MGATGVVTGASRMQDQAALNIPDGADVHRTLAGDQAAFAALYDRYFNRVYDFLTRMLRGRRGCHAGDVHPGDDGAAEPEETGRVQSWLFTIARNRALNRLERGKRVGAMPTTITDDGEELTLDLADEDRRADPSLPALDRELAALVWEAARGLDSGEIAESLGVTKGNAHTMLSRVKDRFEESLAILLVSRRMQPNERLALRQFRPRHLTRLQHLRPARCLDHHRAHRSPLSLCSSPIHCALPP